MLAALGAAGVTANDINRAASRMLYDLTLGGWKTEHNPLQIANAVFVGNNVTLQNSFAQTYYDYYRGASINSVYMQNMQMREVFRAFFWCSSVIVFSSVGGLCFPRIYIH